MQLSRKQVILISAVSGVILLLTLAIALIYTPGAEGVPPEPTPSPIQTACPTSTPSPAPTPMPTVFRLPLVPEWDSPQPTLTPSGAAGAFVPKAFAPPDTEPPAGESGPWVGAYDGQTRDILAVGLQNGRATVFLLMRLDKGGLTVAALPTDVAGASGRALGETPLKGETLAEKGAQAAALVDEAAGMRYAAWLALDLSCLPTVLQVTGSLSGQGTETLTGDGRQRAREALSLATGAATYVRQVSLLKLPALKRAVGDCFASNLSTLELWSIFWALRNGTPVRGLLLSAEGRDLDVAAIKKYFGESS